MFLVDALDIFITVAFLAFFITQVGWPIFWDKPLWPMFRRKKTRIIKIVDSKEGTNGNSETRSSDVHDR